MKAKLNYKGKEIEIDNITKANYFNRIIGLMFKNENSNALLFEFKKSTRNSIHSLFCPDFLAIWLDENNKIIEYKLVNKIVFSLKPEKKFSKLLEIPVNSQYSKVIEFFLLKK